MPRVDSDPYSIVIDDGFWPVYRYTTYADALNNWHGMDPSLSPRYLFYQPAGRRVPCVLQRHVIDSDAATVPNALVVEPFIEPFTLPTVRCGACHTVRCACPGCTTDTCPHCGSREIEA